MTTMTMNLNFWAENITEESKNEFMTAVEHSATVMMIQMTSENISKLEKRIKTLKEDITENGDDDANTKTRKLDGLKADKSAAEADKSKLEKSESDTHKVYEKVVSAMTIKNADHFGNKKDVVETVLRVLATWNNRKLMKYAITPAFQSPALHEALETIHITSKAGEDGQLIMSKEVKEAYKKASQELETIIKTTFSLPFETVYTTKTRVKLTAEDKKQLHQLYVKSASNVFDVDDEKNIINFSKRKVSTLVRGKKDKKTGNIRYDYSALGGTIADIVMRHYFA